MTDPVIILVDSQQLAKFMIEIDLGVATEAPYALKKVDQDFFGGRARA